MITFILHTHLPHVLHHGTWPHGSDWVTEAVAECYLPLLSMCDRLMKEGIRPGITFDISPILCEQLSHPDFPEVFRAYCTEHAKLAEVDKKHFVEEKNEGLAELAEYWVEWFNNAKHVFDEVYEGDIVGAFRRLQEEGAIELMTCGATHGYLPLLAEERSVDMQLHIAVEAHTRHFGRKPRGIWLPECAYRPSYPWRTYLPVSAYAVARQRDGIERFMHQYGLEYFIADEGALEHATPLGHRGPTGERTTFADTYGDVREQLEKRSSYDLYRIGGEYHDESVAVFFRNTQIAMQVWSGDTGYPGDPDYLDFHKRYFRSSHRYWRVTDNKADMQFKQLYNPQWAADRTKAHGHHFAQTLIASLLHRKSEHPTRVPTMCLPFDTELFGHWWFEGPLFLENVLRELHAHESITTRTVGEQFDAVQPAAEIALPESSWGRNGHHEVWMNPDVHWTWEKEYALEFATRMLMEKHVGAKWDDTMIRIVMNMFRQILLAQASDWQFLISTFSSREYAEQRFHSHASDAERLRDMAERYATSKKLKQADNALLDVVEKRDAIFTEELTNFLTQ